MPVTVLSADDISALGVSDGDELVENLVEQGLNFFNEQEQASGGVNASRGDSGAYNLRSMGVGNTLTLLNGRRMVNNAGYQTEYIGGDFVPTVTVNTNLIPTNGLDRLEILRDGASAIYGADAVAGVVNNVLDTDYEGSRLSVRVTGYEHFDATDTDISYKFGTDLNGGATNISIFARHRDRGSISASEDERWYSQDYRRYIPDDSPFSGNTSMRNTSTYGWFQLDLSGSGVGKAWHAVNDGETEMADATDPRGGAALCALEGAVLTGFGTCMFDTDLGDNRSNQRGIGDYRGEMQRSQIFIFTNHEFDNGVELFNELGYYTASSSRDISAGSWRGQIFSISKDYYWFSQLPAEIGFPTNKSVVVDGWRPFNKGRTIDVDKVSTRIVLGLRGTFSNGWDWESAITSSKASNDLAKNRMTYPLLYENFQGDLSKTAAAFNIFDTNWETNNGDNILADITRDDKSTLDMFDFKMSNSEAFDLPAGPVAVLIGIERRKETYTDDRDMHLDGTITNTDCCGVTSATRTHPFTSAVIGSSPTVDVFGVKRVNSSFVEMYSYNI